MTDTFARSCEHWSEAKRCEMESFYALASVDYRHLAQAQDWRAWLKTQQARVAERTLRLLDVACGSGKFPDALVRHARIGGGSLQPIDYALLDPSKFSIGEARRALRLPFVPGAEYETTLQALDCPPRTFDIVWAVHALYALPAAELRDGLERFVHALNGVGFIAHACEDAHYVRFYRHYLDGFQDGQGVPYTSAEQIVDMLERMGISFQTRKLSYENVAPETQSGLVQGYLQRCVFDDLVSLEQMLANHITGEYLATCLHNGEWRFAQRVLMIFIHP